MRRKMVLDSVYIGDADDKFKLWLTNSAAEKEKKAHLLGEEWKIKISRNEHFE